MIFDWLRKGAKSGAEKDAQDAGYSRREFLRGSFVRRAIDRAVDAGVVEDDAATTCAEARDGAPAVDLLAILSDLDPHNPTRQLPPGVEELKRNRRGTIPVLRPPGAVAEPDFLQLCTRCDACLEACPHEAIVRAPARFREAAGTPMIDAVREACRMCADTPCIAACPTPALSGAPTMPATHERPARHKIGLAMIQQFSCLAHNHSFCSVCVERCPEDGAIEVLQGKPRILPEHCTGCGICQSVCPAPINAILLMPNPSRPPARVEPGEPLPTQV